MDERDRSEKSDAEWLDEQLRPVSSVLGLEQEGCLRPAIILAWGGIGCLLFVAIVLAAGALVGALGATGSELGRTVMAIGSVGGVVVFIAVALLGSVVTIRRFRPWSGSDSGPLAPGDRAPLAPVAPRAHGEREMTLDEIDRLTPDEIDRLTEDEIEQAAAAYQAKERRAEQMRRSMEMQGQRVPRHWDHSAQQASDWGQGEGFVLFIVAVPGAALLAAVLVAAFWLLGMPVWIPVIGSVIGVVGGAVLAIGLFISSWKFLDRLAYRSSWIDRNGEYLYLGSVVVAWVLPVAAVLAATAILFWIAA